MTTLGHACVLVEHGATRVLVDPGTLADGFSDLRDLSAVLVTHAHPDHLDTERVLPLLAASPARVVADRGSAAELRGHGVDVRPVRGGDTVDLGDGDDAVSVTVHGDDHARIHPDVPGLPNVGYALRAGGTGVVFHPGDAHTVPPVDVDVLCLPLAAPWLLAERAVEQLREVAPRVAVPVHDGLLADAGRSVFVGLLRRLAPPGCEVRDAGAGQVVEVRS